MQPNHLATLILAALLLPATAPALTIDNFEEGDFNVTDVVDPVGDGPAIDEQSGLLSSNVVGGVRLVRVNAGGQTGVTANATLDTDPATDDGAAMTAVLLGSFIYIYDGIADGALSTNTGQLNLDLSAFDTLALDVVATAGTASVTLWDSVGVSTKNAPLATGIVTIPLGDFTIDPSDIRAIRLTLGGVGGLNNAILRDFSAIVIPEPGTGLLLAAGLLGLAARRRTRRPTA